MLSPLLSIILPNYNDARYLHKSIRALLSQDYENLEVIVIDDGSRDESLNVVNSFNDTRLKLIARTQNRGVVYSQNEGLQHVSGEFIYYASANDCVLPQFFSTCMSLFKIFPEAGISYSNAMRYDSKNKEYTSSNLIPFIKSPTYIPPSLLPKIYKKSFLKIGCNAAIMRTSLVRREKGILESLSCSGDWYLATKLALMEGLIYVPQAFVCMTQHKNSFTDRVLQNKTTRKAMYASLLEELLKDSLSVRLQFKHSGELGCVLKFAALELCKRPQFWQFCPTAIYRFVKRKFLRRSS